MAERNLFLESAQRRREWSRGYYYTTLNVLDELSTANASLADLRNASLTFYKGAEPALFKGIERVAASADIQVSELQQISGTMGSIEDRLYKIRDVLDVGFDTLAASLDITNTELERMTDLLANPTKTQSLEFARRASSSLKNGWHEEALEDFMKVVELDKFNYIARYLMGILLAEQKGDSVGAFEAFANAARYAKPDSKYYCSSSQYWQGVICNLQDRTDDALNFALLALKTDPRNIGAVFLAAELFATKGQVNDCLELVEICEEADVSYFFKCKDSIPVNGILGMQEFFESRSQSLLQFNRATRNIVAKTIANLLDQGFANVATFFDVPEEIQQGFFKSSSPSTGGVNFKILADLERIVGILDNSDKAPDYVTQRLVHDSTKEALSRNAERVTEFFNSSASKEQKFKALAERTIRLKRPSDFANQERDDQVKAIACLICAVPIFFWSYSAAKSVPLFNIIAGLMGVAVLGTPLGLVLAWVYGTLSYQLLADNENTTTRYELQKDIERLGAFQSLTKNLKSALSVLTIRDFYQRGPVPPDGSASNYPSYSPADHIKLGAPNK
ncbi:MAG: hypothetical protein HY245_09290 [Rhizobiales bacterium]|nr:hypothetical protein [Hyphomicrobiales bacterium]MBI3673595.1 hypothetical protein [Hyphomicrobiales bacterium]